MRALQSRIKLVGYDANGTLFDDTAQFFRAINGIFERFGAEPLPFEVLRREFGQPWTKIYRDRGISEAAASDEKLYEIYNELYRKESLPTLFPDVADSLQWLESRGVMIVIVSTQQNSITEPLLRRCGVRHFFARLAGGVGDKSLALRNVCAELGVEPQEAAYVGDQEGDIIHAKGAGCVSIGFSGGLHDAERLIAAGPAFLIHRHTEIKNLPIFG